MRKKMFNPYKIKRIVNRQLKNSDSFAYVRSAENVSAGTGSTHRTNPYDQNKTNSGIAIKMAIICISVLGSFALYAFHPIFKVKNIHISGLHKIKSQQFEQTIQSILNYKILFFLPGGNYPFIDVNEIKDICLAKFPIDSITVTKSFPQSLNILVTEKQPAIIYTNGEKISYLDKAGYLIETLRLVGEDEKTMIQSGTSTNIFTPNVALLKREFGNLPIIYDLSKFSITNLNKNIIDPEKTQTITNWLEAINKQFNSADFYMTIDGSNNVTAVQQSGGRVLLTLELNENEQLPKLQALLNQKTFKKYNYSYIDLRYPKKIYWQ